MNKLELGDNPLIWWTSQEDCEQIGEPIAELGLMEYAQEVGGDTSIFILEDSLPWPEYIKNEYSSRFGSNGRGRLWLSLDFAKRDIEVDQYFFENSRPLVKAIKESCGGIVILQEDGLVLCAWPGFITDFSLQIWRPEPDKIKH